MVYTHPAYPSNRELAMEERVEEETGAALAWSDAAKVQLRLILANYPGESGDIEEFATLIDDALSDLHDLDKSLPRTIEGRIYADDRENGDDQENG